MALPGNGTIPAVDARRIHLAREAGQAVLRLLSGEPAPAGHHQPGRHLQRLCGGHGAGRQHQLHPPSHGHRPRGRRGVLPDHGQRDQPPDPSPVQDQPVRGAPHRGPGPGRRHTGRDEGSEEASQPEGEEGFGPVAGTGAGRGQEPQSQMSSAIPPPPTRRGAGCRSSSAIWPPRAGW